MSPKTGRPKSDDPKNARIEFRATQSEKQEIVEFCKKNNVTVLDLVKTGIETMKKA